MEKGENADASLARTFGFDGSHARPAKLGLGNLGFKNGGLDVFDYTKINDWHYGYVIDPSAATKTIDLTERRQSRGQKNREVLGIYEIDGDRLRLCLARRMPEVKTEHRPSKFAIEPGSGDILVVLDRYHPSDDETAMQGWWNLTRWIEDGKSASAERVQTLAGYWEGDQFRIDSQVREAWMNPGKDGRSTLQLPVAVGWGGGGSDERRALRGQGFLDPTKQPKTITIAATDFDGSFALKTNALFGIYKFENDRLIIAYRLGAGRPDKFESTPGSGVTLLVLERPKAGTVRAGPGRNRSWRLHPRRNRPTAPAQRSYHAGCVSHDNRNTRRYYGNDRRAWNN